MLSQGSADRLQAVGGGGLWGGPRLLLGGSSAGALTGQPLGRGGPPPIRGVGVASVEPWTSAPRPPGWVSGQRGSGHLCPAVRAPLSRTDPAAGFRQCSAASSVKRPWVALVYSGRHRSGNGGHSNLLARTLVVPGAGALRRTEDGPAWWRLPPGPLSPVTRWWEGWGPPSGLTGKGLWPQPPTAGPFTCWSCCCGLQGLTGVGGRGPAPSRSWGARGGDAAAPVPGDGARAVSLCPDPRGLR